MAKRARGIPRDMVRGESRDESRVPMKRLSVEIPEELHRRIKVACAMKGVKISDEIRALLEERFPAE